ISVLFDLDLGETLTLVAIIYLIENWVKPFILLAILFSSMSASTPDDARDPLSGGGPGAAGLFDSGAIGAGGDDDAEYDDEGDLDGPELQGAPTTVPPTSGPAPLETDPSEFDE
ncbi:MAG: hypothetical protein M3Q52_04880, partial [Pseudomonadota bacterium]|nr:hypothetical protein [Pseudomonadota bacterium]